MIVKVDTKQIDELADLAAKLWPEHTVEELAKDFYENLSEDEQAFLYKLDNVGSVGFIQLSLRHDYVEGCHSTPVAYVEGIYIIEKYRRQGLAQELIIFAENWGRKKGCIELASDCELNNVLSVDFHLGAGFEEANRIVCFKKTIRG